MNVRIKRIRDQLLHDRKEHNSLTTKVNKRFYRGNLNLGEMLEGHKNPFVLKSVKFQNIEKSDKKEILVPDVIEGVLEQSINQTTNNIEEAKQGKPRKRNVIFSKISNEKSMFLNNILRRKSKS